SLRSASSFSSMRSSRFGGRKETSARGRYFQSLLLRLGDGEFAGSDPLRQALGKLGDRLLAIAGDHVGEGGEDRRGRDAVGIEPVMHGFLPRIDDVAQCGALGLVRILEGWRCFDEFFHSCPSNGTTRRPTGA